jgi:general stress protein CsbA
MDRFLLLLWPLLLLSLLAVPTWGAWVAVAWGVAFVAQMAVDAVHLWLDELL